MDSDILTNLPEVIAEEHSSEDNEEEVTAIKDSAKNGKNVSESVQVSHQATHDLSRHNFNNFKKVIDSQQKKGQS